LVAAYLAATAVGSALFARLLPNESRPTIVGTVAIVLTGAIVLWYTWETRRLRLESHDQVVASRDQADIARRMFEASHRPFVEVQFAKGSYFERAQFYHLMYKLVNHGHVPAIVTTCQASVADDGNPVNLVSGHMVLFPDGDREIRHQGSEGGVINPTAPDVVVAINVKYSGAHAGSSYETRLVARGRCDKWQVSVVIT
jgi:hypothetical protein